MKQIAYAFTAFILCLMLASCFSSKKMMSDGVRPYEMFDEPGASPRRTLLPNQWQKNRRSCERLFL